MSSCVEQWEREKHCFLLEKNILQMSFWWGGLYLTVESTEEALVSGHLRGGIKLSVITEAGDENCCRKRVATKVVRKNGRL